MTRQCFGRLWAVAPLIAALAACADQPTQPVGTPQPPPQKLSITPGGTTLLLGHTSPLGLAAQSAATASGVQAKVLATTTFIRFARSPAEGGGGGFVDMPVGGTAYFRDVAFASEAVLEAHADGEFWDANIALPGGGAVAFPRLTFHTEFNGEQDCWVSGGQSLCGSTEIFISYILGIQCQRSGSYTFRLLENGGQVFEGSFTLKPMLAPGTVPAQFQTSFPDEPYNTLCVDPADATKSRDCQGTPGEVKRTIAEKGCALASSSMVLNYLGISIDPKALNDYLIGLGLEGYAPEGVLNWKGIVSRASLENQGLGINNKTMSAQDLRNRICRFGPQVVRVLNKQHFVVVTGLNDAETDFTISDPGDPLGRKSGFLTTDYGGFLSVREFEPLNQVTFEEAVSAYLFSPAELVITDPAGRQVGFDPLSGRSFAEIPGAIYDSSAYGILQADGSIADDHLWKELEVPLPVDGEYLVKVTGTATGQYTLNLSGYDRAHRSGQFLVREVPIASGEVHQYGFDFNGADMSGGTLPLKGGFPGGGQRTAVNALLSYARPGENRNSLPAGTASYALLVFYDLAIDPATFQAELNGAAVTSLFTPTPGGRETVTIPLQPGSNVLKLSVTGSPGGQTGTDRDRLTFLVP